MREYLVETHVDGGFINNYFYCSEPFKKGEEQRGGVMTSDDASQLKARISNPVEDLQNM
jgi:hypothetical protein